MTKSILALPAGLLLFALAFAGCVVSNTDNEFISDESAPAVCEKQNASLELELPRKAESFETWKQIDSATSGSRQEESSANADYVSSNPDYSRWQASCEQGSAALKVTSPNADEPPPPLYITCKCTREYYNGTTGESWSKTYNVSCWSVNNCEACCAKFFRPTNMSAY